MLAGYSLLLTGIFHSLKKRSDVSKIDEYFCIRLASCAFAKFMAKFISSSLWEGGVMKASEV